MAVDELVRRVGETVERRKFLTRVGAATLGVTYAVLGLPQPAQATHLVCRKCCCLCHEPGSGSCCGAQLPFCIWSWTCCGSAGNKYRCSEVYCSSGDCDSDCSGVHCSFMDFLGSCGPLDKCNSHC